MNPRTRTVNDSMRRTSIEGIPRQFLVHSLPNGYTVVSDLDQSRVVAMVAGKKPFRCLYRSWACRLAVQLMVPNDK